jgi:hypothetical protein
MVTAAGKRTRLKDLSEEEKTARADRFLRKLLLANYGKLERKSWSFLQKRH